MKGRIVSPIDFTEKRRQRVTFELDGDFSKQYDGLKDVDCEVVIRKYSEKRSKRANRYFWELCGKLAEVLGTTKEELYINYVRDFGLFKDFTLTPDEAKTFTTAWRMLGTGWPTEQVDYSQDGERVVIRAYYGSSQYNTKQMSRLINAVVEDCKEQGIETLTPEQLAAMMEDWNGDK